MADDWFLAGYPVEYRNHGLTDEYHGLWRVYGTGEFADIDCGYGSSSLSPSVSFASDRTTRRPGRRM